MRETREAIHIRRVNHPLNRNDGKVDIPKVFNKLLAIRFSSIIPFSQASQPLGDTANFVLRLRNLENQVLSILV